MAAKRRCSATTKTGKPCRATPMRDADTCLAHADEKTRDTASFGGAHGGRPKKPRVVDVIRERIEGEVDAMFATLREACDAQAPVVVGQGRDAFVEMHPDFRTRIAAVRELLDRAYGRPKQQTEITGADNGPVEMLTLPGDATSKSTKAAQLLAQQNAIDAG